MLYTQDTIMVVLSYPLHYHPQQLIPLFKRSVLRLQLIKGKSDTYGGYVNVFKRILCVYAI